MDLEKMKLTSFLYYMFINPPSNFLKKSKGIIHVGAHIGQERFLYQYLDLNVCWIEPIEDNYNQLKKNIDKLDKQNCYRELISESDKKNIQFNIASNDGKSSSVLDLKDHIKMWPEVKMNKAINVDGISLPTFIEKHRIDIKNFDSLLLDTQGYELEILKGAMNIIHKFSYIQVEAADFEAYSGCPTVDDICKFMNKNKFDMIQKNKFSEKENVGNYFDIIFINRDKK